MQLFASFYEVARDPADIIAEVDLEDAANIKVKHLSGGQERRLLIGIALIGNPAVLVLDEPSAGLDPSARRNLWEIIERQRQKGTTVLLSTHHMDEATQVCDRLAILVGGRIAAEGEPDALIREHSATATVSFEVSATRTTEEIRALGIEGDISSSGSAGTAFSIVTEDPDAVIRRLTFTPGLQAFNYRVTRSSLEDVFVEVSATSS
ncbi:ABC transporter ATP-binding protein [Leucobacter insecticola]|uniref:ABC transporter ATP-binding protein n=1 Tax=Leucobacter insecticola TaxID=2714934 RepID=A0A6G8FJ14_9MICO|nr:ABC transporter ATP-binding protein [Leucobacter insecticola]QIM16456.1 ABC transporter ATP-binding protein [Leucobacter insecticola]